MISEKFSKIVKAMHLVGHTLNVVPAEDGWVRLSEERCRVMGALLKDAAELMDEMAMAAERDGL